MWVVCEVWVVLCVRCVCVCEVCGVCVCEVWVVLCVRWVVLCGV